MAVAVEVHNLSKRYGSKVALDGVSLSVSRGTVLGLVGPNGAGKSTLLKMLLGVMRPSAGAIYYDGQPLWPNPTPAMQSVGGFVDSPRFYPYLSGRENLSMLADLARIPRRRVDEVLAYVHLTSSADQRVQAYSHGMRQRLGIATALLKRPGLVILDEPQDGLDPARLDDMRKLIGQVRDELGSTIIMSSHVIADVERLCDEVAVFHHGRVRYVGRATNLGPFGAGEVLWEVRPVERALQHLRAMGLAVYLVHDDFIRAKWDDHWDLGQVNASLMANGVTVRTVTEQVASLESRLLAYLEDAHADVR